MLYVSYMSSKRPVKLNVWRTLSVDRAANNKKPKTNKVISK